MSYQSLGFLAFSLIVLFFYYVFPGKCQKYILLLANIIFYLTAGVKYVPFLLTTMVVTFWGAKSIGKVYRKEEELIAGCNGPAERKQVKSTYKKKAKWRLVLALIIAVGLLILSKYTMFIMENVARFIELPKMDMFKMIVPLGVSFYTFMAVGYILDIFWKRYKAETSFVNYAVFLSYFPHVVQGPIDRYNEFRAQLPVTEKLRFDSQTVVSGAQLVIWGFFKKIVIADRLGIFVSAIYDNFTEYKGLILVIATILYSIQIYADFSGCIDIVSGVSEMFGIKLRKNFNHPYFAKTMPEFWRRWHISLGEWFTDYIYYPVSISNLVRKVKKSSKKKENGELFASCFPIVVVWLITGIWHGASWNFVAWGVFHATLMVLGVLFAKTNDKISNALKINRDCFSWRLWQMARTFILCGIGRVIFKTTSLKDSLLFLQLSVADLGMEFVADDMLYTYGIDMRIFLALMVCILVLWFVDMMQERMQIRVELAKQNLVFRWAIVLIGIFAILILGAYGPGYDASSFIYEQF